MKRALILVFILASCGAPGTPSPSLSLSTSPSAAVALPISPPPRITPSAPPSATTKAPAFSEHGSMGTVTALIQIPAGRYQLDWQAEGVVTAGGAAGGCAFTIKLDGRAIASSTIGPRAVREGHGVSALPAGRLILVDGTDCVWSVDLTPA